MTSAGPIPITLCDSSGPAFASSEILETATNAAARIRDAVDPDAMHAAALIDLLWADSAGISLDRAIHMLRAVSRLTDRPGQALTDLAAAYLVRAERRQSPRDLFEAAEAADRAIQHEPANLDARFNLALALERVGLVERSAVVWKEYRAEGGDWPRVTMDSDYAGALTDSLPSRGATDADLAAFVAADPQRARTLGWDYVLGEWGTAQMRGEESRADSLLTFTSRLGDALVARGGDESLRDAVQAIRRSHRAVDRLADAHATYSIGRAKYQAADYLGADTAFTRALPNASVSAALRGWILAYKGTTLVYRGEQVAGIDSLSHLVTLTDAARYPALAARAHWSLGTALLRRGQHDVGLASIQAAESLYARTGEHENLGGVHFVHADAAFSIGDGDGGYRFTYAALRALGSHRSSVWLHNTLSTCAQAIAKDGLVRVALRMQDEGVTVAERIPLPIYGIEAHLSRSLLRLRVGDARDARTDVARAAERLQQVALPDARAFLEANLRLADAAAVARTHPLEAVGTLDSVVTFFSSRNNPVRVMPALVARADAWLMAGNADSAVADLRRALGLLDLRSGAIQNVVTRSTLLDAAREVTDRLVMLQLATERPVDALESLERVRVSYPWLRRRAHSASPAGASPLRVPRNQIGLEYARVGDTLLVWTVTHDAIRVTRTVVPYERLLRTIETARTALELRSGIDGAREPLVQLYDWLIRPIEPLLGVESRTLTVVADGDVAQVPFAALFDSVRSQYLIERFAIRYSTSLSALPSDRLRHSAASAGNVVVVADPAFDSGRFPALARLPGALSEAQRVAATWQHTELLSGTSADYASIVSRLPSGGVVHYAGHAVFDDAQPQESYLVVAASPDTSADRITARSVAALDLQRVRLVVLSACRTLRAYSGRSGGFLGLAGAFLAAGAGGVVASDWLVDDELTGELMTTFHQQYRATGDAASALRNAQLALLRSHDRSGRMLGVWSAFRYVGM